MRDLITFLSDIFSYDPSYPLLFIQFNFWAFFLIVFAGLCLLHSLPTLAKYRKPGNPAGGGRDDHFKLHLRNGYLFLVSLFFYYKTSGLYIILLIFSTIVGYILGILFDLFSRRGVSKGYRTLLLVIGVVVNLGVLFYFKYAYFFTDIHNAIFHSDIHVVNHFAQFANHFTTTSRLDASVIIVPVGISFFTFQNISYIVDVYKGEIGHVRNILDFGFYTTFFPQLVAGPIIRAKQFIPQLYKPYFLSRRQFGVAVFWILNGLIKKIVLSDYLAVNFADNIFEHPEFYTPFHNLSALFIYSLQVYADFSGYTDIAIGVAMLMGFYLPKNFNSPYKATSPAGFWKRWHISLSNWLKDYLYIPLGGNRNATLASWLILGGMLVAVALMARTFWVTFAVTTVIGLLLAVYIIFPRHRHNFRTNVNNMDTMLLGGLWHGPSFNFIIWGGLNGLGILIYKAWKPQSPRTRVVITQAFFATALLADIIWPCPALNVAAFWSGLICVGTMLRYLVVNPLCQKHGKERLARTLEHAWSILLTFIFITFTRLFFRCGSNLSPAEANEVAWNTAKNMVNSIGSTWNLSDIPLIIANKSGVFLAFLIGMVIHWLPERFKRRYRLWFAQMPLWMLAIVVILTVFFVYQFITADIQPFIYFQF